MIWLQNHLPELAMSAAMAWARKRETERSGERGPATAGIGRALTQRPQA
jgi:hypothetical protein